MSSELLLKYFDRISEAPDAIPRLRRFIRNLAVRGKLVEQDPNGYITGILRKRIRVPKSGDELFAIPNSWAWVPLGVVADSRLGKMLDRAKNKGTPRRYLRNINVRWFDFDLSNVYEMRFEETELEEFALRSGDVLICEGGEPGRAAVWDEREDGIYFQKAIHRVRLSADVVPQYFVNAIREGADSGRLATYLTGVGIKHLTGKGLTSFVFPLPPLAEQHRIVAKVEELMALCDRLEATQAERESRRDRLAAASLNRLNQPADPAAPEALREHVHFYLNHLPRLTTRPEHIKQLRQTILNLAVRGQLVPQDPNDEPASELLKRIQAEQTQLRRMRASSRDVGRPSPPSADVDFELPLRWRWTTLQHLIVFGPQNGISPIPTSRADAPRAITLTATTSGTFSPDHFKQVDATIPPDSEFWLRPGDLLFQRGNTREYVGMAAYYTGEPGVFLYPDLMIKVRVSGSVNLRYIHLCAVAPHGRNYLSRQASGAQSTMPKINQETLLQLPIPLPPLAEQHRIIAKLDELVAVCDRLEAQLTSAQTRRRCILESLTNHEIPIGLEVP